MSHLMQPTIVLLKDGSETAQGTTHVIHNINACQAIAEIVKTTLGPRGMDKLMYAENGAVTISNDGRTIIDLLDIVHPAAKTLVDIAVSQDDMVGDGTTSVVILAAEFLKEAKIFIEDGVHPRVVIKSFERATKAALEKLDYLALDLKDSDTIDSKRTILERCAMTTLQSKLISAHREFFAQMTVDAVSCLDPTELNLSMIGIAKVPGGSVTSSELVEGVAFRKTFSYAGFEQQPKSFKKPKIVVLNVELELKAEKENAEIRLKDPTEYQSIVDAEWKIIYDKLDKIVKSGAQIVLSKLAIGDLATQYFADRDIFCAGRVPMGDLERLMAACGGVMQTSLSDLSEDVLGTCGQFEERQVGNERYNFFTQCEHAKSATIILRGGAEQFIEETHRSLWDALNVVKRCMQHSEVVGGAGAIEMELSRYLRDISKQMEDKSQMIVAGFARALEVIPRQLAHNAGLDATTTITRLRAAHSSKGKGGDRKVWMGVDIESGGIVDAIESFIWEPALNKRMAIGAATEAACTILSIDETIKNAKAEQAADQAAAQTMAKPGGMRGGLPSIM